MRGLKDAGKTLHVGGKTNFQHVRNNKSVCATTSIDM